MVKESANEGIRSLVQQSRRAGVAASSSIFQMLPVLCNHFFPFFPKRSSSLLSQSQYLPACSNRKIPILSRRETGGR